MRRFILPALSACLVTFVSLSLALAEVPHKTPELLRTMATDVITGTVQAIYERDNSGGGWNSREYVAEIVVDGVEAGKQTTGDLAYARYWSRRWDSWFTQQPADTNGHAHLPKEGDRVRVFAVRKGVNGFGKTTDDGLDVIGPNGFQSP